MTSRFKEFVVLFVTSLAKQFADEFISQNRINADINKLLNPTITLIKIPIGIKLWQISCKEYADVTSCAMKF